MMKKSEHQHNSKPHTEEKSQEAATSLTDAKENTVHTRRLQDVIRKLWEFHQVLARGAEHIVDLIQGQNCINKEIIKPRYICCLILCGGMRSRSCV
jgi:nitric oxide reductase activation protein